MCGIVGYIGNNQAVPVLFEGLNKLEYRGYDSSGIAVLDAKNKISINKRKGRLKNLEKELLGKHPVGVVGIGHTRWATHGAPSDVNAHPHSNTKGDIVVAHNGIIENYLKIKEWLSSKGYFFKSQTDTELIAHLIDYYYKGENTLLDAVQSTIRHLVGSYGLVIMAESNPEQLIAVKKDSPLVIGIGENENYIASDAAALLKYTRDVYFLEDGEIAVVSKENIDIMDSYGIPVFRDVFHITWDIEAVEKGGYPHYMLKEINEQPKALKDTLNARLSEDGFDFSDLNLSEEYLNSFSRIVFIACGTAYHAGLVAKYMYEKMIRVPVEIDVASEYRYRSPVVTKNDLVIVLSQSGETLDSIAAMRMAKSMGATIIAITNVVGSVISREADAAIYTIAGPEIAVASTKAYTTQLMCLSMLGLWLSEKRNTLTKEQVNGYIKDLKKIPEIATEALKSEEKLMRIASLFSSREDVYFLGRNIDSAIAMESSLKLKEISYIHSEAFPAGELKHGPIALIEEGTLVIVIGTQSKLYEKTASNIKEVKARGAYVLGVCSEGEKIISDVCDETIFIPKVSDEFMAMPGVIPMQIFSYYCAVERGFDVDKPRNLAKSVTVE